MSLNEQQIAELKTRLEQERNRLSELLERTSKHLYHRDEPLSADFAELLWICKSVQKVILCLEVDAHFH